jgi:hypothetical protein
MPDWFSQDADERDSRTVRLDLVEVSAWILPHPDKEFVEFGYQGPPGMEDITAMQGHIVALPDWTPRFSRLCHVHPDIQLAQLDPEAMKAARQVGLDFHRQHYGERPVRAANLVAHSHNRPMIRQWEAMNSDGPLLHVKAFSAPEAAVAWLTEPAWRARA